MYIVVYDDYYVKQESFGGEGDYNCCVCLNKIDLKNTILNLLEFFLSHQEICNYADVAGRIRIFEVKKQLDFNHSITITNKKTKK